MRAIRDLLGELVERRLWPLAVLLVAALVAVPVVLAKHTAPQSAAELPPAAVGASAGPPGAGAASQATEPVVSVAASADAGAPLRGHAKDPFVQQHVPPRVTSTATATAAPGGAGATPSPAAGGGGSPKPRPKTYVYATIDVRFGHAGFPLREIKDVPRLAPLPNATGPVVVFMGMRADHETAVFMVSTDVHVQGEGRCVPSKQLCEAIELRRGDTALLDVTAADGSVAQYEMDLTDVVLHQTTSQAKASQASARASKAGIALVRHSAPAATVSSLLRWSPADGVLLAVPGGTYLQRDGSAPADALATPQASAGAVQQPPVLTPLP